MNCQIYIPFKFKNKKFRFLNFQKKSFKKCLIIFLFYNFIQSAFAQSSGDYRSCQNGNWTDATTWQVFDGSKWNNASTYPSYNDRNILIQKNHIVTIIMNLLPVAGLTVDQLAVEGILKMSSSSATPKRNFIINNGSGVDFLIKSGGLFFRDADANHNIVLNSGSVFEIQNNAVYEHATTDNTIPEALWDEGSTLRISGFETSLNFYSGAEQQFWNVEWNCSKQTTAFNTATGGVLQNIRGDFSIINTGTGKIRLINSQSSYTMNIGGNFNMQGGSLEMTASSSNVNINLNGNFNFTGGTITKVSTASTPTINFIKNGEQLYNRTSGVFSNAINFSVASGSVLNMSNSNLDGNTGTFYLNDGATLKTSHINGVNGNITCTNKNISSKANYIFYGSSEQTTGSFIGQQCNDLQILNSDKVSLSNNLTIAENLNVSKGEFSDGGYVLSGNSIGNLILNDSAKLTIQNSFPSDFLSPKINLANKSIVSYSSSGAQTISAIPVSYGNLEITGTGTKTLNGDIKINGYLNITNATLDVSIENYAIYILGDFNNSGNFIARNGIVNFIGNTAFSGNTMITTFNKVNISAGSFLTLKAGGRTMKICNKLNIFSSDPHHIGQLIVEDNTSSITGCGGNDTAVIQLYDTLSHWHYLSAPLDMSNVYAFHGYYLKQYDEGKDIYENLVKSDVLELGRGYAMKYCDAMNQSRLITLKSSVDKIHSGTVSYPLTYTGNNGWHLVGNPYPCAIDWEATDGWDCQNTDPVIYFYDAKNLRTSTYNKISHLSTNGGTRYIAPMQGFYLHCNSAGLFSLDNRVRIAYNQPFYKKSDTEKQNISLKHISLLLSDSLFSDEIIIGFDNNASNGFDNDYDAYSLPEIEDSNLKLSSITNDKDSIRLVVNFLPENHTNDFFVPLEFSASSPANYNFKITENNLNDNTVVSLLDSKTNQEYSLNEKGYDFFTSSVKNDKRFLLHFQSALTNNIKDNSLKSFDNIDVYLLNNNLFIKNISESNGEMTVKIFDLQGKLLLDQNILGKDNVINLKDNLQKTSTGIYCIQIITGEKIVTKKIYLQN